MLSDVVVSKSRTPSDRLRKIMVKDMGIKHECSLCGISNWIGIEITLHVDHISGDCYDDSPENLRFLCPNCHSQTETFGRGKPIQTFIPTTPLNRNYSVPHNAAFAKDTRYGKSLRKRIINEHLLPYKCCVY